MGRKWVLSRVTGLVLLIAILVVTVAVAVLLYVFFRRVRGHYFGI